MIYFVLEYKPSMKTPAMIVTPAKARPVFLGYWSVDNLNKIK